MAGPNTQLRRLGGTLPAVSSQWWYGSPRSIVQALQEPACTSPSVSIRKSVANAPVQDAAPARHCHTGLLGCLALPCRPPHLYSCSRRTTCATCKEQSCRATQISNALPRRWKGQLPLASQRLQTHGHHQRLAWLEQPPRLVVEHHFGEADRFIASRPHRWRVPKRAADAEHQ